MGDEGGFAPDLPSAQEALDFVMGAIRDAGFEAGKDMVIALDVAASEFFKDGAYIYAGEGVTRSISEQVDYLARLQADYPILSIEDGLDEDDFDGWKQLTDAIGGRCQLVGDDLFVTQEKRLREGVGRGLANSILIKVNQVGTLTETLETVDIAHRHGYSAVMSHRSGETEDTTIADLAVATNCGLIKTGSLSRSDRTAKYNQLLRIEEQLGGHAHFAGADFHAPHGPGLTPGSESMMIERAGLQVDETLAGFIEGRALQGSGVDAGAFWNGLANLYARFAPRNRALLAKREDLQRQIDGWHRAHDVTAEPDAYRAFLTDIGYLVAEPAPFEIGTRNVDPEIATLAAPQLVVPALNARFVLNAANARWAQPVRCAVRHRCDPGRGQVWRV